MLQLKLCSNREANSNQLSCIAMHIITPNSSYYQRIPILTKVYNIDRLLVAGAFWDAEIGRLHRGEKSSVPKYC